MEKKTTLRCKTCGSDYDDGRCRTCGSDTFVDVSPMYPKESLSGYGRAEVLTLRDQCAGEDRGRTGCFGGVVLRVPEGEAGLEGVTGQMSCDAHTPRGYEPHAATRKISSRNRWRWLRNFDWD